MEIIMTHELLSKLLSETTLQLEEVRKGRKQLEHSIARVQPFLSKYLSEGNTVVATEFKVCTKGPFCCKRGGVELFDEMKQLAAKSKGVTVIESDCLRRCGRGPNVEVGAVVFTDMTSARAKTLIENQSGKKGLAVDLLLDDEYAPEVANFEEKRCRLLVAATKLADQFAQIEDLTRLLGDRLPADKTQRVLAQRLVLDAIKLHSSVKGELTEIEETLKKVVPLDDFAGRIFARDFKSWQDGLGERKSWSF